MVDCDDDPAVSRSDSFPCSVITVFSPSIREASKPLLIKDASVNSKKCRLLIDCGAMHNVIKPCVYERQRKPITVHVTSINGHKRPKQLN